MSEPQGIEKQEMLPGMEDLPGITQDAIDKAVDEFWHGTARCCPFCGKRK